MRLGLGWPWPLQRARKVDFSAYTPDPAAETTTHETPRGLKLEAARGLATRKPVQDKALLNFPTTKP